MKRGEIRWAARSYSGMRQPVMIIQADEFNRSRMPTVLCVAISDNLKLAHAPGNVFLSDKASGLGKDAVANVAQVVTIARKYLSAPTTQLGGRLLREVDDGLRLSLAI